MFSPIGEITEVGNTNHSKTKQNISILANFAYIQLTEKRKI